MEKAEEHPETFIWKFKSKNLWFRKSKRPFLIFADSFILSIAKTVTICAETFEKCIFLFAFKEGENFNHRNTLSISRIKIWAWRRNRAKRGVLQRSLWISLLKGVLSFEPASRWHTADGCNGQPHRCCRFRCSRSSVPGQPWSCPVPSSTEYSDRQALINRAQHPPSDVHRCTESYADIEEIQFHFHPYL